MMNNLQFLCLTVVLVTTFTGANNVRVQQVRISSYGQPTAPEVDQPQAPNKFAVDLYKNVVNITGADKNVALSPFSAEAALTMTYVGAVGATKSELGAALGINDSSIPGAAQKFKSISAGSQNYVLQTANAIFLEQTYEIRPDFRNVVTNDFGANITSVDFINQAEVIRMQINTFVEAQTNNKIQDLFAPKSLSSNSRLVLVNALYFKAEWAKKFDKTETTNQSFTLANGQQKQVQLMNLSSNQFNYAEIAELNGAQAVELNYKGDETSMVVILPKIPSGITGLENSLTAASLNSTVGQLSNRKVIVLFPKFQFETSYDLVPELQAIGIKQAFQDSADFSGISKQSALTISVVVQKVFVSVDEDGTEAAAATGVGVSTTSFSAEQPVIFRADHPFLYLIRHKATNSILFIGKVSDPTS